MHLKWILGLVAISLSVACGNPTGDDDDDNQPTPTPTLGNNVDLSGTWATQIINSQIFDGILGEDTVVLTVLSRIAVTHTPGETNLSTVTEVCDIQLTPYSGNQTTYPQVAVSAIAIAGGTATLSAPNEGASFTTDTSIRLVGWNADGDPATETLPTDGSDSRVSDPDGDGNPGITLGISGGIVTGDIYIVNRSATTLTGYVVSDSRLEGTSRTVQAQNIVGASEPLLELGSVTATPDETAGASTFLMVKVADADTCGSITSGSTTLFE